MEHLFSDTEVQELWTGSQPWEDLTEETQAEMLEFAREVERKTLTRVMIRALKKAMKKAREGDHEGRV